MINLFAGIIIKFNMSLIVNKAANSIARYNNIPTNSYAYVLLLQDLKRVIKK